MKIALVYDRVNKWGGAERVLLALHKIFKTAPLYTSLYHKKNTSWAQNFDVRPSFLQKFPGASVSHEFLAPLMPLAFESFNFDKFDVVISVTSEAAKGIITKPNTLHICICLTPIRYIWSGYENYFRNKLLRTISYPLVANLRNWDKAASNRPDYFIAISKNVQSRIKKYYSSDSYLIYPPVELASSIQFQKKAKLDASRLGARRLTYFLVVSRLVYYKRIDLVIHAFNKLALPLKIVGIGREFNKLKSISGRTIEFLGNLPDERLADYYANAKALIFPGTEDFGLVMAEAQSFGTPVIACKDGGAREIIIEGKTGEFFNTQDPESLIRTLQKFNKKRYNSKDCIRNSERFSLNRFEDEFVKFFNLKVEEYFGRKEPGYKLSTKR